MDTTEEFAERMVGTIDAASLAILLSIGHQTRLFDTMAELPPATSAQIADAALTKACRNKDLTPNGVLKALNSITALDTGGTVAGTLDFSDPSKPPGRLVYIAKASKDAPGGLAAIGGATRGPTVDGYTFGGK